MNRKTKIIIAIIFIIATILSPIPFDEILSIIFGVWVVLDKKRRSR